MAEIVDDRSNGLRFDPGNPEDLAAKVRCLFSDASALKRMRRGARETFDRNFTADANHEVLTAIYARAVDGYSRHHLHEIDAVSAS
jgi:glycosyltransferase involved in cell wall biosynthesis